MGSRPDSVHTVRGRVVGRSVSDHLRQYVERARRGSPPQRKRTLHRPSRGDEEERVRLLADLLREKRPGSTGSAAGGDSANDQRAPFDEHSFDRQVVAHDYDVRGEPDVHPARRAEGPAQRAGTPSVAAPMASSNGTQRADPGRGRASGSSSNVLPCERACVAPRTTPSWISTSGVAQAVRAGRRARRPRPRRLRARACHAAALPHHRSRHGRRRDARSRISSTAIRRRGRASTAPDDTRITIVERPPRIEEVRDAPDATSKASIRLLGRGIQEIDPAERRSRTGTEPSR